MQIRLRRWRQKLRFGYNVVQCCRLAREATFTFLLVRCVISTHSETAVSVTTSYITSERLAHSYWTHGTTPTLSALYKLLCSACGVPCWRCVVSRFYRASSYASAVLGVVILSVRLSVCLSVCPSVTRVLYDKSKQCTVDILIPHERAATLVFWHQQWLVGDAPFTLKSALKVTHPFETCRLRPISAYNVSTVRDSEKSSIMTNRKSTTGFPTSYRWSA